MGKKGKRSRRKTVTSADPAAIAAKIQENDSKFSESYHLKLYSQAANELREKIQLIETNMLQANNIQSYLFECKMISYSNLMMLEFIRHNFDSAIQIYENLFEGGNLKMKMKILSPTFPSLQLKYQLALLRQGKGRVDVLISLSNTLITHEIEDNLELDLLRSADILRTMKHFDEAIVVGEKLGRLTGDRLSLVTTYLEQYIVGDRKSLPAVFALDLRDLFQKHKNEGYNAASAATMLVLAQSTYLFFEDKVLVMGSAIGFIEEYLDLISNVKSFCITCMQIATESEVQFVCSGCRVACYCSIDHQRMTWKKEAERGMRFGHEVLCPVMKAYRKWRHAKDNGDNDRASRLRQRFERECLYLLSDGLGLKDKCLQK
ncbi:predicted protein [Chaetoceros tenuissimus]|uniref:MYND-type domain-containing protein n=1 Tax=Chaetoceros tenuissimus TaxID=426638 RepID=A0AAD3HC00_9STRA|nr:predicted protein [Chaetoceros tenuissimus]